MASITYPGYVTAAISVPTRISYRPDKLLRDRPMHGLVSRSSDRYLASIFIL